MPRFAANLSMLYTELPFLDRFEAAAQDGFQAVESLFPYAWPLTEVAARLRAFGLQQVLLNAPPGGFDAPAAMAAWEQGLRGRACWPACEAEFRAGVQLALHAAEQLDCPRIHVMAGLVPADVSPAAVQGCYVRNLRWAAGLAQAEGREVLIEPINLRDMPGYFLTRQDQAHAVLDEVGAVNLKVQMDLYHCQIMEGDLVSKLNQYVPTGHVGHIQIAGVPQRHEPDVGEVNYPHLFDRLDELAYSGWVGCEYWPRRGSVPGATSEGLGWLRPYQ